MREPRRRSPRRLLAVALIAAVALAACGGDDDDDDAGGVEAPPPRRRATALPPRRAHRDRQGRPARTTAASSPGSPAPAGEGDPDASVVVGAVLEPESLDILHQAGAAIDQVLLDNVYETL